MSDSEQPAQIVAALLWDVPTLRRGSQSAQDFVTGLSGESQRWWETRQPDDDALGRAAQAVAHERGHELELAAAIYADLSGDEDPWVALLGLMLQGWSETQEGTASIIKAKDLLESLQLTDSRLTAHLYAKLATYAFDQGDARLGVQSLERAIVLAPSQSLLEKALVIEGLNVGIPFEWSEDEPKRPPDPLVEYPWIEVNANNAAQATLAALVETRSRRLWTFHIGMGKTPLDDIVSAEVQATWAGALWMRRPIRKQLGAQLLSGAARNSTQWAYGVVMWTLGGGQNPERAYAFAEPMLDGDSADFIVKALRDLEVSPRFSHRLLSVAVEAWDELSDDVLRSMVKSHRPTDSDHPTMNEVRRLWAGYAARLPDEWFTEFQELQEPVRAMLLTTLGEGTVSRLPADHKEAIFNTAKWALQAHDDVDTQLLRTLAAAAPADLDTGKLQEEIASKASAGTIARLAYAGHVDLLSAGAVTAAEQALVEAVEQQSEEARKGTVSCGASDARLDLGRLVASCADSGSDSNAIELLMHTSVDGSLPGEHLLHARNALSLIRRAGKLTPSNASTFHTANDPLGSFASHGDISVDLLKASRLRIVASDLTPEEIASVVELCRAQDGKVRNLALNTCAEGVEHGYDEASGDALCWSLVGGLFDPSDEIVAGVTHAITLDFIQRFPIAGQAVIARLPRLLDVGNMSVRAAVRERARQFAENSVLKESAIVSELLSRSAADRSWLVRSV